MIENKELIKIKFNSYKDQKNLLIKKIESSCNVNIVDQIGNIVILFKQNLDIEKRNFKLMQADQTTYQCNKNVIKPKACNDIKSSIFHKVILINRQS